MSIKQKIKNVIREMALLFRALLEAISRNTKLPSDVSSSTGQPKFEFHLIEQALKQLLEKDKELHQ